MVFIKSKPIRTVLRWQLYVTLGLALAAGLAAGRHGALSALAGGAVSLVAGLIYGFIVSRVGVTSAGNVLRTAMRAEAAKVGSMVMLLWLVMTTYKDVVPVVFFFVFIVTVLIFTSAFFVSDEAKN